MIGPVRNLSTVAPRTARARPPAAFQLPKRRGALPNHKDGRGSIGRKLIFLAEARPCLPLGYGQDHIAPRPERAGVPVHCIQTALRMLPASQDRLVRAPCPAKSRWTPYCLIQECSRAGRALPYQNAPGATNYTGSAAPCGVAQTGFSVRSASLLSRPDLALPKSRRAARGLGGAEPPAATHSALLRASMARMANSGPSPK
jgi:hypothetical protein